MYFIHPIKHNFTFNKKIYLPVLQIIFLISKSPTS
jgi:hypothetical protein